MNKLNDISHVNNNNKIVTLLINIMITITKQTDDDDNGIIALLTMIIIIIGIGTMIKMIVAYTTKMTTMSLTAMLLLKIESNQI